MLLMSLHLVMSLATFSIQLKKNFATKICILAELIFSINVNFSTSQLRSFPQSELLKGFFGIERMI